MEKRLVHATSPHPQIISRLESLVFTGMHLLSTTKLLVVEKDCPLEILLLWTFVLNLVPLNMVFHFRLIIWTLAADREAPLFCSVLFPTLAFFVQYQINLAFISFMARSESHCLQSHKVQCVKYKIFYLNHSKSSTVFLLPYLFLRLIAIEQIFTNAGIEDIWLSMYINVFLWYAVQNAFCLRSRKGRKFTFIEC